MTGGVAKILAQFFAKIHKAEALSACMTLTSRSPPVVTGNRLPGRKVWRLPPAAYPLFYVFHTSLTMVEISQSTVVFLSGATEVC